MEESFQHGERASSAHRIEVLVAYRSDLDVVVKGEIFASAGDRMPFFQPISSHFTD
jgi:hypothetical protein